VARVAVLRVPRELRADLVVAEPEVVDVTGREEVIALIGPAVPRQEQEALLRNEVVELELPDLEVDPPIAEQIVEPHKRRFEMEGPRSLPSWYPRSRKACPKAFNSGHAVWHAEHGRPYFRANAGIALVLCTASEKAV